MRDHRDLPVSGATPAALELFEQALAELQCYRDDPLATIDRALALAPGFAMARALKAYLGLLATDRAGVELARPELAALEPLALRDREAGHRAAIAALVAGEWEEAVAALDSVLARHPRDALALQVAHGLCFFLGDARNLRDTVARVRDAWEPGLPGFHAVLGMHAFGLEECGDYARAEREGRRAVELEPRDAWAHHAVTHVYEMQARADDGVAWMTGREPHWAPGNFFAIHNWWHLALFHLRRGEVEPVLALYDARIRGTGSTVTLDLIDASALLWRLALRGVEVGDRWTALAEAWLPTLRDGLYAFNDVHAAMAFLGAGRLDRFGALRDAMTAVSRGTNVAMTRAVGLPVIDALRAFVDGDHAGCREKLRRVRPIAHRFGGSHAQRDLLDQTLAEAARRSGEPELALALAREAAQRHAA